MTGTDGRVIVPTGNETQTGRNLFRDGQLSRIETPPPRTPVTMKLFGGFVPLRRDERAGSNDSE
jgi:hypothetical protein